MYNMNGLSFASDGTIDATTTTAAQAGFEEWSFAVPDGGSTLVLLGSAFTALAAGRRSLTKKS
jgi:protein with PEP-CTERM/exosortase system signal